MNITSSSDLTMEEMTEASDRIYNEVGEDADIIWGTVVDDSLGEEIRVTVIATGIGTDSETTLAEKHADISARGKIRDITPADIKNAEDYDVPTFIRQKKAVADSAVSRHRGIVIDNNDLDIPTFLRRKAD
jgi:cell division protein FtsZ